MIRSALLPVLAAFLAASPEAQAFSADELRGQKLRLHPVQGSSGDRVVRGSRFDCRQGRVEVPARTAAVFVSRQPPQSPLSSCWTGGGGDDDQER